MKLKIPVGQKGRTCSTANTDKLLSKAAFKKDTQVVFLLQTVKQHNFLQSETAVMVEL